MTKSWEAKFSKLDILHNLQKLSLIYEEQLVSLGSQGIDFECWYINPTLKHLSWIIKNTDLGRQTMLREIPGRETVK